MKIAFLTSCLEPGRDGVGDYTRSLANECVRQGHKCLLISINDYYITQTLKSEDKLINKYVEVIRLSNAISNNADNFCLKESIDIFQPDWISLQFSPYGIQKKGIVFNLVPFLKKILNGYFFHVMLHELWIGESVNSSVKYKALGFIQKFFILNFLRQTRPKIVHTSNNTYISILKHNGVFSKRLKMFGALPITLDNANNWLYPMLRDLGCEISEQNRDKYLLFGFFGSLYKEWSPEPLFSSLRQIAIQNNIKIVLISIGKLGLSGESVWEAMSKRYINEFTLLKLGTQPDHKISNLFNSLNFGIAASPYHLIGKSSSVAAMLEHQLPVIVTRNDFQLSKINQISPTEDELIIKLDNLLPKKLNMALKRNQPCSQLKASTHKFIEDLDSSN